MWSFITSDDPVTVAYITFARDFVAEVHEMQFPKLGSNIEVTFGSYGPASRIRQ